MNTIKNTYKLKERNMHNKITINTIHCRNVTTISKKKGLLRIIF